MASKPLSSIALVALALAAPGAHALSPGPPRPIPPNVVGVCSDGQPAQDPNDPCGVNFNQCNPGATCLASPVSTVPGVAVRATLTLIADEDVTGWDGGNDPLDQSSDQAFLDSAAVRNENARLTLLLDFETGGKPFSLAETFKLDRSCDAIVEPSVDSFTQVRDPGDPSLCISSAVGLSDWAQPASENYLIWDSSQFTDLQLQWTIVNPDLREAILDALLTPQERAANPNAFPLFEVIDGTVRGNPATPGDLSRLVQSDHSGTDPLASIRRLKVTIRVAKGQ
jgi:hypothetical protein